MDYSKILNEQQLQAVTLTDGPVLVSAGAGSGKTRVLTYRVAYLITEKGVAPYNILAITFTNKAANEMKERITKVAEDGNMVTVSTFHSFCARMLRAYASFLNDYKDSFSIYTEQDQQKIFKLVFTNMGIDKSEDKLKNEIKNHIYKIKSDGLDIEEYCAIHKYDKNINYIKRFYLEYQNELKKNNAMDFDDLLINFYKLIKTNLEVRESIQNKYRYIHVDEFQDTNTLQYEIVRIMADKYKNIMVVGDEDQSIYSWRGAQIDNIIHFTHDFKGCKIIKLEQNYRSTKNILEKANMLIKNNSNRLEKELFTSNDTGANVEYYSADDDASEADYVIRQINTLHNQGVAYNEMAILMRINALTRPFEEKLLNYDIPHKIYNGFKFYERAEIKNTLAYLVAIANPQDDTNTMRVIGFPSHKIGDTSIAQLQEMAVRTKSSLKDVILNSRNLDLKSQLKTKLEPLADMLREIDDKAKEMPLYDLITYIIDRAGILESFDKHDEQDYERFMNVNSLINSISEYANNNPDATLTDYLQTISLTTQIDEEDGKDGVVIATVHGAKGLEFDVVFVVGMEEKIFPVNRDIEDNLEEERRLMYVAITRARKKLYVTNAKSRFMYGQRDYTIPSRFLKEIELIKDKKFDYISPYADSSYSKPYYGSNNAYNVSYKGNNDYKASYQTNKNSYQGGGYQSSSYNSINGNKFDKIKPLSLNEIKGINKGIQKQALDKSQVEVGAIIRHSKFGNGTISDIKDFAKNGCVTINFESLGNKVMNLDYAPIEFLKED